MSNVTPINKVKTDILCPHCCHLITKSEANNPTINENGVVDRDCPNCGKYRFSEFEQLK